jgi:hypothetical protein
MPCKLLPSSSSSTIRIFNFEFFKHPSRTYPFQSHQVFHNLQYSKRNLLHSLSQKPTAPPLRWLKFRASTCTDVYGGNVASVTRLGCCGTALDAVIALVGTLWMQLVRLSERWWGLGTAICLVDWLELLFNLREDGS